MKKKTTNVFRVIALLALASILSIGFMGCPENGKALNEENNPEEGSPILKETSTDFELPKTVTGLSGDITWTSKNEEIISIDQSDPKSVKAKVHNTIWPDQEVILTATADGKTKEFTVIVKGGIEVEYYKFTKDTITVSYSGFTLKYTDHNFKDKTFTAELISIKGVNFEEAIRNGLNSYKEKYIEKKEFIFNKYIKNKTSLSLQDLKNISNELEWGEQISDGASDEEILKKINNNFRDNFGKSVSEFKPEEAAKKMKKLFNGMRKSYALGFGLNKNTSWDDIFSACSEKIEKVIEKNKRPLKYKYELINNGTSFTFEASSQYINSLKWYEQPGIWGGDSNIYTGNAPSRLYMLFRPANGQKNFVAKFNDDFSEFTYYDDEKDEYFSGTVIDNKDSTIKLTLEGSTYTLEFEGDDLGFIQ